MSSYNESSEGVNIAIGFITLVYIIMLFVSWSWLWALPVYFYLMFKLVDKEQKYESKIETLPASINTHLVTVGHGMNPCILVVKEDCLLVTGNGYYTKIPMESIEQVLFENKSTKDLDMAGFSVDYRDSNGPARVMFWNDGNHCWNPVSKTRKHVSVIKNAHKAWYAGTTVPELDVHDVGKIKLQAANECVHRAL